MLISSGEFRQQDGVIIMTDLSLMATQVSSSLYEIARQAAALGTGLQNAAPDSGPNPSIDYLFAVAESLTKIASLCKEESGPLT